MPLCSRCDALVLKKAEELVKRNEPVVYKAFFELVPVDAQRKGGFWNYDVMNTLEHHNWVRHTNRARNTWGICGYPKARKPETHFHPPA
jgi:hypothetical protein